ncbi:AraC family transcriptional regulator [Ructibacterium gallinarum]|uniref:Helix-turn-helix domain-containing protein n=1 Tax=Ructibacterium gallinarum TaxID=2779355 RepID=A0A9D5R908_9FIRM|nr:helix-turn-helix domain-containing protein [Ructibacterium gallinarum]MBE5040961.1 helix-turn-helix domain-containing protein [Ructibacterium gallinarum]
MSELAPSDFFLDFYYGDLTHCGASWQGYHEKCTYSKFYFIIDGHCCIQTQNEIFDAQPGCLLLIPAGTEHSYFHTDTRFVTKYWFHFHLAIGGKEFLSKLSLPLMVHVSKTESIENHFCEILKLCENPHFSSQVQLKAEILQLTAFYMEQSGYDGKWTTSESTLLEQLKQYIESNYTQPLTLKELADFAHLHPNYLIRFFKKNIGVPPMRYIMQVKLEKAESLLENTNIPVSELAELLGFSDMNHFYKRFKSYAGKSPTEFRSSFRKIKSDIK